MELISIIVPIYNVENYLVECIESIINQTYENIEIILVNDGSTDRCGEICDYYKKKDFRIKIIHKKNGGLSDARNAGLNIAKGKYVGFVDGDDWISKTMFENLYNCCKNFDTSISTCGRIIVNDNITQKRKFESEAKVISSEKALDEILLGKSMDVAMWDKLYNINLFDDIRFPVNEKNEDIAVFYKLIDKVNEVSHCGTCEYYYRNRPGSITKLKYSEDDSKVIFKNLYELEYFLKMKYPNLIYSYNRYRVMNIYYLLNKYIKCIGVEKRKEYLFLIEEFKKLYNIFKNDPMISIKDKIIAKLIIMDLYNPYLIVKEKIKGYK